MNQKFTAKAIIFDRDGVIIDTDALFPESIMYGLKQVGITAKESDVPWVAGTSMEKFKELLLKKWTFDFDEYRAIQRKYYYDNLDKAPYFTETVEYIKKLHAQNRMLALTTSAAREGTMLILKKVNLDTLFSVIVTKEDCTKLKPDPEPYLLTAKKLGISPEDCVAIEDSSSGVRSAKKSNMYCIAIPNRHTKNQDFSLADKVVNSIEEVQSFVDFQ